jgi:nucleoside-triphosphatase THEP1
VDRLSSLFTLASNFAGVQFLNNGKPEIWMITGSRGVGKTRFCQDLGRRLRALNLSLGGVISGARMKAGHKTGIFLEVLQTGEERLLGKNEPGEGYSLRVGCWYFSPDVLQWGNEYLQSSAGCDVVVFDECGFLELEHGDGLQSGLRLFDDQDFKVGVVVVRLEFLSIAQDRWPEAAVINLDGCSHD